MKIRFALLGTSALAVWNGLGLTDGVPVWRALLAVALVVPSYLLGRYGPRHGRPALLLAAPAVLSAPLIVVGDWAWPLAVFTMAFTVALPWLLGRYHQQKAELVRAGWDRAERLELAQQMAAEQARLRERTRIASDMHDSLGHELALIALRAGALELDPNLAEPHRRVAGELRTAAAAATERLRGTIGVLREAPAPHDPVGESIADLVDRSRAAGLDVALAVGPTAGPVEPLPALVDRAAYRVVQEGLTNASRHAPGAAITVRLCQAAGETVVTVSNEAPQCPASPEPGADGNGLVGLRERVRLVGGSLRAGPQPGGGFELRARLPHAAAPGPMEATPPTGAATSPAGAAVSPTGTAVTPTGGAGPLRQARRKVRRDLVAALTVPIALGATVAAGTVGVFMYQRAGEVLAADEYHRLVRGQSLDVVDLPRRQALERPDVVEPPAPAGTACRYYRASVFELPSDVYRLCVANGRLVTKDLIPGDSPRRNRS